jgi:beta-glucosidase
MYDIFSLKDRTFPEGFLWGSATASHQIEGGCIHNNWWAKEQRGETKEKSGKACNSYELYRKDNEILGELGHKAHRFSLEWSRFEPVEGAWDETAVAHYADLLEDLQRRGIKPFVTLYHGTHPQWFEELGGFGKRENHKYFERFAEKVVKRFAPLVYSWNIFNEVFNALFNGADFLIAHARVYRIIKSIHDVPISSTHAFGYFHPWRIHDRFDRAMADYHDTFENEFFFHAVRTGEIICPRKKVEFCPELKDAMDYWAINFYTRMMVDSRTPWVVVQHRFDHKRLRMVDEPFYMEEMFPEALIYNLERLKDRPVIITENGCSCDNDEFRKVYLTLHLSALGEAMERGVDVQGYLYWSFLDNYEWGSYMPKFGMIAVNRDDFTRTVKPSALLYRDIIKANGMTQEIIRKHIEKLPELRRPVQHY